MTTTTTAVPPFRDIPSEEVDSDEHGGPPGSKSTTCNCGWANKAQTRIVNGVETKINEFPFMAAIIDRVQKYQFCGGSIITAYHALTAAHCTIRYVLNGNPISIVIGDHNLYNEETSATKTIDVERIIQHENYIRKTLKHDISLLLLAEKIEFNQLVGPVCISPVQLEIPKQYVKIIGWGNLKWRGPSPDVLQKVNVRVLHRNSCNRVFSIVAEENPTQICTYASQKSACQGDSGGPVVWLDPETNRYVQVGLVSFGTICADRNPTVHTDVPAYYNWIQENIEGTYTEIYMLKLNYNQILRQFCGIV
ncbi:hypothetical protein AAG570_001051 [Ranatra chinensis]|uniref:Peptidase S1 domain-containing protein n=1 Tax=Ranatra chinensis TaxID=642074 RepID=A0ABD0YTB3_9HEMI